MDWRKLQSQEKTLFTPGPVTTSKTVKYAMLKDLGSRDVELKKLIKEINKKMLNLINADEKEFVSIMMQGSGTYGLESVITTTVPRDGKLLVLTNGVYGKRIAEMGRILEIPTIELEYPENKTPDLEEIDNILKNDYEITNVCAVHCETTTGIINPVFDIGNLVKHHDRTYMVDAVSTAGAYPISIKKLNADYLITDPNKNIEGIPGFSIIIAKKNDLEKYKNNARSMSLDLYSQLKYMEENGEFRFTPPVQSILALNEALNELEAEGGVEARASRYKENYKTLISGMRKLGFKEYLFPNMRGYIITSFLDHDHPNFSFKKFYKLLQEKNQIIYQGRLSTWTGFRIATIGRIFPNDIKILLNCIHDTLLEMGVEI